MAGKVIQTLRVSPLATLLTEAELRLLSNCGRILDFDPGQRILGDTDQDDRIFILRQGQVLLRLTMWSEGERCGGETSFSMDSTGEIFGWGSWIRPDRITLTAEAQSSIRLVALDLDRLGDSQVFFKLTQWMLQGLYRRLQEDGICPPNLQGLLKLKQTFMI
jgi:CRP-like cAMP-binding protein